MKSESTTQIVPAKRVSEIQEYYFSRRLREVAQLNAQGADIISLGIGGPDRPPHSSVISTLADEAAKPGNHSYQPYVGIPQLRQAMADWYNRWYGVTLNPDTEIQPLIGSKEGILHVSLAFLNPGDGVLVPNPGYPTYTSVSRLAQAEIFNYDLTEEGGWMPDFDALERLPLDRIKLMWINYPHMPTGTPASLELFEKIVAFGKKHNIVIAHDNPYSFILNEKPLSLLQVDGARDIAIEMNSMSKSHNMAGWRVGMLASNPTFINWILKVKSNIDSGQFKPLMLAAVKGLEADKDWYDEVNATYASRRKVAEEIMSALNCTFDPRQKGLFLWGRIPDDEASSESLADRVLYEGRVFITPGFIFGSNGDRYIRISLCATEENMRKALDRINKMNNKQ
ncbi:MULTISPECIES: pyridoxal phosphate-dependent aminotransferase [Muribaculum]|uniref:Aminotransferase n=12 Tax=Muribaculum TaxID=1918540 RepID=A0A4P7VKJ4_9BACT|nr:MULTISPECIES: aminotransferase class I/II-fold pyridoxal phosphate-dependent enzyme [Muribaculum]MCX4277161.1 aminotransferase class I/II-fold pyridoxal phosphate-dependent enzyme [Muribaculum sp.]QCD35726.1 aminotransferase class I/II-fold pyridoxal phosphate-dependent enzyme [Muribaculum gordoncarteri]